MKRRIARMGGWMAAGAFVAFSAVAIAGEFEDKGRAILEKNQKAVVTVQMVIKQKISAMGMGSQENENKEEATGFVIAPDGLAVLALSSTDPGGFLDNMMSSMGDMGDQFKMESNLGDVKMLLDDGTELPAQVVLRDNDLDLAFVRPTPPPAQPMTFVDLSAAGEAQTLDPLIALNRLGKVANRACSASIERIQAVVRKPRTFYIPGNDPTHSGLGSPVFTMDGNLLGILVMRSIKGERQGAMAMLGGMGGNMMAIVVPVADIKEAAAQAPLSPETAAEEKQ
ncbi:MAG TPA: serine protease [Candidatus Hydrogenedentes bacterium]|nr:serine protease [Candidatus Hydrogenedentota bacterium]